MQSPTCAGPAGKAGVKQLPCCCNCLFWWWLLTLLYPSGFLAAPSDKKHFSCSLHSVDSNSAVSGRSGAQVRSQGLVSSYLKWQA